MIRKKLFIFFICILLIFNNSGCSLVHKSRIQKVILYTLCGDCNKQPIDLVVYFHGAGCSENFIFKSFPAGGLDVETYSNSYRSNLIFASIGYDSKFHWSHPSVIKDTVNVINEIVKKYNIRKIILVGISMGGSTALNVVANADKKLQEKITDVLSVFPVIDYSYALKHSKRENIKDELSKHFNRFKNPEEAMKESSPITYAGIVPKTTKITLIEGINDTHVCSNQIEKYYEKIKTINSNNVLLKWDIDHVLTTVGEEYTKLVLDMLA